MNDLLDTLDLEIRIASVVAVHARLEAARMRDDSSAVTDLLTERRLRVLVDELIALRGRQIDGLWQARRRQA